MFEVVESRLQVTLVLAIFPTPTISSGATLAYVRVSAAQVSVESMLQHHHTLFVCAQCDDGQLLDP